MKADFYSHCYRKGRLPVGFLYEWLLIVYRGTRKILKHYGDYEDTRVLLHDNLFKHLKKNGSTEAILTNSQGKIEFSMSDPKYKP